MSEHSYASDAIRCIHPMGLNTNYLFAKYYIFIEINNYKPVLLCNDGNAQGVSNCLDVVVAVGMARAFLSQSTVNSQSMHTCCFDHARELHSFLHLEHETNKKRKLK